MGVEESKRVSTAHVRIGKCLFEHSNAPFVLPNHCLHLLQIFQKLVHICRHALKYTHCFCVNFAFHSFVIFIHQRDFSLFYATHKETEFFTRYFLLTILWYYFQAIFLQVLSSVFLTGFICSDFIEFDGYLESS